MASSTPQQPNTDLETQSISPHVVDVDEVDGQSTPNEPLHSLTRQQSASALDVPPGESLETLFVKNKVFSREAFYAQAALIYIIAIACIVNLSVGSDHSHVWVSLLSASLGFILPAPKVRGARKNTLVGVARDPVTSGERSVSPAQ